MALLLRTALCVVEAFLPRPALCVVLANFWFKIRRFVSSAVGSRASDQDVKPFWGLKLCDAFATKSNALAVA